MTVAEKRISLASRSPRPRELLKHIGVALELVLSRENSPRGADVDETPFAGETPLSYVTRITRAKAQSGSSHVNARRLLAHPVLAADTVVVLEGKIIGKRVDAHHAREI